MKKFRVGIIGCGRIAQFHGMPARAQECADVVACCDIRPSAAKERAKLFGCKKIYTDYEEMIRKEKLDVVHVCLPHYLHAPVSIRAMELGCHVLTEKPMAISMKQAEEMVKTAKKTGKILGVIFQNRYNAGAQLVKRAIDSGMLGDVLAARATVNWFRDASYYEESFDHWKGTWDKEGGGVLIDQAIHTLDLMCWLIGYGEKGKNLASADVSIANRAHKNVIEVEDCADGMILFKNGVRASFWCMNYYSHDALVELEITCQNGYAKITAEDAKIVCNDGHEYVAKCNPNDTFDYGGGPSYWGTSHAKQVADFYAAIQEGRQPWINGELILQTTHKMIMGLYQSGKTGKPVKF